MKNTIYTLGVAAIAASTLSPIAALADSGEAETTIEEIVVTANRTSLFSLDVPGSVIVVSAEEIAKSNATHLPDLLRGLGAVSVSDFFGDGASAQVSIRGFGDTAASNTLILVDGRRLNNTDIGGVNLNAVSLSSIERIEILQDSAAVLYGDKAVGGVVNIITKKNSSDAIVGFGFGSFGYQALHAGGGFTKENGFSLYASAQREEADGYRDNGDYKNESGQLSIGYEGVQHAVNYSITKTENARRFPGALSQAELEQNRRQTNTPNNYGNVDTVAHKLYLSGDVTDAVLYEIDAAHRDEELESFFGFTPLFRQERDIKGVAPRLHFALANGGLVSVGYELDRSDYNAGGTPSSQNGDSWFIRGMNNVSNSASITWGYRKADIDTTLTSSQFNNDVWAAELGGKLEINSSNSIAVRAERNYRVAVLDEYDFVSPTEIRAQTGYSYALTWEHNVGALGGYLQVWQLDLENEIALDPTAGGLFGANINLPPTLRNGLTLGSDIALSSTHVLTINSSYIDAEITEGTHKGNKIPGVAELQGSISLASAISSQLSTNLEWLYVGSRYRYDDIANAFDKLPSHQLINASFNWSDNGHTVGLAIKNLLDEEYVEYATRTGNYPSPTRSFNVNYKVSF